MKCMYCGSEIEYREVAPGFDGYYDLALSSVACAPGDAPAGEHYPAAATIATQQEQTRADVNPLKVANRNSPDGCDWSIGDIDVGRKPHATISYLLRSCSGEMAEVRRTSDGTWRGTIPARGNLSNEIRTIPFPDAGRAMAAVNGLVKAAVHPYDY